MRNNEIVGWMYSVNPDKISRLVVWIDGKRIYDVGVRIVSASAREAALMTTREILKIINEYIITHRDDRDWGDVEVLIYTTDWQLVDSICEGAESEFASMAERVDQEAKRLPNDPLFVWVPDILIHPLMKKGKR